MGKPRAYYRRTGTTDPGRCRRTAAEMAESSTSSPRIQLNRKAIVGLYLSKCKEALAQLPELFKVMKIIEDMERIAENDRASIEELVSYERYARGLATKYPHDQQIQDQKLMEEIDGRAGKRQQLAAEITDDTERVKKIRSWVNVVTENYKVSTEEKQAIENLYQDKMDELDREVAERHDETDNESINLYCSEALSRSTSGDSAGSAKSNDSAAGPMIAIIKARPAVKSVQFKEEQLGNIKTEPVTPKAPEASKGVQPVYCPSESLPKDIEDLAVTDPQLCPWCSQPCRDPVQVGECDGPPVEYCE